VLRLLLRSIAINLAGVYIATQILGGVITFVGGYKTLLMAAVAIAIVNLFVKPIVNLLLLPIHLVTLGLFRWLANLVTLYLVTLVVPNLQIHSFVSPGFNLQYLIIPPVHFSAFGAFLVATFVLTLTFHLLYWLLQD
jgi:putative membrane protein